MLGYELEIFAECFDSDRVGVYLIESICERKSGLIQSPVGWPISLEIPKMIFSSSSSSPPEMDFQATRVKIDCNNYFKRWREIPHREKSLFKEGFSIAVCSKWYHSGTAR